MFNLYSSFNDENGVATEQSIQTVLVQLLLVPDNADLPGNKYRYYTLVKKIQDNVEVALTKEEIDFIMEKVCRTGTVLSVGNLKEFFREKE